MGKSTYCSANGNHKYQIYYYEVVSKPDVYLNIPKTLQEPVRSNTKHDVDTSPCRAWVYKSQTLNTKLSVLIKDNHSEV